MWKGNLPREILSAGKRGYAASAPLPYPEGTEVVDCALGTNPLGMPPSAKRALEEGAGTDLCRYPSPEPEDLKLAIPSRYPSWRLCREQILVGSGSMGVLVNLLRLLLRPGTTFSGISPQFTDTVLQALYAGASYRPVILEGPQYRMDCDGILQALRESPAVFYLDRPNNPTGQVLPLRDVERIAARALDRGTWVISDEAYGDFIPDGESSACLEYPNLVTCRSFSKGLGLAGIRVGYAITRDPELAGLFRAVQPPFAVGTMDAALAAAPLEDRDFLDRTRLYVEGAKKKTLDAIAGRPEWWAGETDGRVPILLLSQQSGDLPRRLARAGIACEPGEGFFHLDNRSARLRVPAPGKLEIFLERLAGA